MTTTAAEVAARTTVDDEPTRTGTEAADNDDSNNDVSEFPPDEADDGLGTFADMLDEFAGAEESEEKGGILSRQHEDLWHQLTAMPLAKTCEVRAAIFRLLIHGTFQLIAEDYNRMADVLVSKRGILVEDLLDHFYFNREYWRRRMCQMGTETMSRWSTPLLRKMKRPRSSTPLI